MIDLASSWQSRQWLVQLRFTSFTKMKGTVASKFPDSGQVPNADVTDGTTLELGPVLAFFGESLP